MLSRSLSHLDLKPVKNPSLAYLDTTMKEIKPRGFQRYCGLCGYQFPLSSCTHVVTFKHIVALRKNWDPTLVPDEVMALEQTASFFNKVFVCVFCAQFFDPTIRDKIIANNLTKELDIGLPNDDHISDTILPLKPYYDDRY
jgi:hypothetical protein